MAESAPASVADVEQAIRVIATTEPRQAVADLTAIVNRGIIELHKVARAEASAQRGQPAWGAWARLANAVRGSVLAIATVRDALKALPLLPPTDSAELPAASTPASESDE
jgi:hypothetical protein